MPNQLKNLEVEFVSLVDRAAVRDPSSPTEAQRFLLWKAESGDNTDPTEGGTMNEAEQTAALQKAESERDEALARAEKAEAELAKKNAEPEVEEIDKSELDPKVAARLEKLEKAERESAEKAEKAEALAKAERDARIEKEFIAKAQSDFSLLPVSANEFGPVLKRMTETLSEDDMKLVTTVLKAQDEHLRANTLLLKELGASGDPEPGEDLTSEQLKKAEELQKADPNMSTYEALRATMMGSKEAQQAYLASVRGV